jgi:rod shape-determining protein MreC
VLLSRRARETIFSVLLLAGPVVLLYGNLGHPQQLNLVDRWVLRLSGGIQYGVTRITRGGLDAWERYVWLVDLDRTNTRLRRDNAVLRENNQILTVWAKDSQRHERELGFVPTPELRMVPAEVVSRGLSPFYRVVRVRSQQRGYLPVVGQPVVMPEGLVGRVRRVYGLWADVLLADDVESRIPVIVQSSAVEGELRGLGQGGRLAGRIEYWTARDEVRVGDAVHTSGMGRTYPPDLRVGTVTAVRRRSDVGYQVVEVRMAVEVRGLERVHFVERRTARPGPATPPPVFDRRAQ